MATTKEKFVAPHQGWLLLLNWVLSIVFATSGWQLASDQLSSEPAINPWVLTLCLVSLLYLVGFYSVSQHFSWPLLSLGCISAGLLALPYSVSLCASLLTLGCVLMNPLLQSSSNARTFKFNGLASSIHLLSHNAERVETRVNDYSDLYAGSQVGDLSTKESIQHRQNEYKVMVDSFYDLVTDFYEYGWGQSFHFAPRYSGESFTASITRAEHFLALKTNLSRNSKVLDMGCGVGGPLRSIAHFTHAAIQGITINQYQVSVANKYIQQAGLAQSCGVVQGDFMHLPFEDDSFDAIYAIESLCHAPDKTKCLQEALRVLKPGGILVAYDWVVLGDYDEHNSLHVQLREGIEIGNGLPTIPKVDSIVRALDAAGFEILDHFDPNAGQHDEHEIAWYATLKGSWSLKGFRMTSWGRSCTHALVVLLEWCKIAPKGSIKVSQMLNRTADDLVHAGELGIFSPSYFYQVRKPAAVAL